MIIRYPEIKENVRAEALNNFQIFQISHYVVAKVHVNGEFRKVFQATYDAFRP